jgi:hypothetical protein
METADELKSKANVRQLKDEISWTQAELQQTVAEISDRLSPAHLKHQAADTVREAATSVREATIGRMQHMVRGQNPIPYALIGLGAAWLLASNRSSRRHDDGHDYAEYDGSWNRSTSYLSSDDESRSPYAEQQGITDTTARWASHARERAAHAGNEARARATRVASQARSRWDTVLHDNPMALGIAALAAGALVGAVIPRTEVENDYMGSTRDSFVDSAKSVAQESMESARDLAKETIQKVTGTTEPYR